MLAFGTSALAVNASLVLDKIDAVDSVAGRSLNDFRVPLSALPREAGPNRDGRTESISIVSELVVISRVHEGMAVTHVDERTASIALANPATFLARAPLDLDRDGKLEPISTVAELIAITDPHGGLTVSQVAERASIPAPEPPTILAGAPLLLPFFASTLRILRRNKTGRPKWLKAS